MRSLFDPIVTVFSPSCTQHTVICIPSLPQHFGIDDSPRYRPERDMRITDVLRGETRAR
jgi:hypothetical protein